MIAHPNQFFEENTGHRTRWSDITDFFRKRGGVLFLSDDHFWDIHPMSQQCLAYLLARNGIRCVWIDGFGWRPYRPRVAQPIQSLQVKTMWQLPLLRFQPLRAVNAELLALSIRRIQRSLGGRPVVWVQAGIDESLATLLPYIDVFSVFDDAERYSLDSPLYERSSVVIFQNSTAYQKMSGRHFPKCIFMPPPLEVSDTVFDADASFELPREFPNQVMGYIGSFHESRFDFPLLETLIQALPNWGFLLVGRTCPLGEIWIRYLSRFPNFLCIPHLPRRRLAPIWKKLSVTLLLYRNFPSQLGAFPSKALESIYFGVPCVATDVTMCQDLKGIFPLCSSQQSLCETALEVSGWKREEIARKFNILSQRMDPQFHLAQVAAQLIRFNY